MLSSCKELSERNRCVSRYVKEYRCGMSLPTFNRVEMGGGDRLTLKPITSSDFNRSFLQDLRQSGKRGSGRGTERIDGAERIKRRVISVTWLLQACKCQRVRLKMFIDILSIGLERQKCRQ